jgi:hypothetical protein
MADRHEVRRHHTKEGIGAGGGRWLLPAAAVICERLTQTSGSGAGIPVRPDQSGQAAGSVASTCGVGPPRGRHNSGCRRLGAGPPVTLSPQRMLTKQVPGADRRVREPHWGSLSPEIPAHNPDLSLRTPQAQGLGAKGGENPRRQHTFDERGVGQSGIPERAALRARAFRRRWFSFSDTLPEPPRILREALELLTV